MAVNTSILGKTTELSLDHSPTKAIRLWDVPELIVALAQIKKAASRSNCTIGNMERGISARIIAACDDLIEGRNHEAFVLPVIAAGGGTATNMNANEAIAIAADRISTNGTDSSSPVHPNDHVNLSQSSNDVYPTALKLALYPLAIAAADQLDALANTFRDKAVQYEGENRLGRTVWQDAVVVPISDTHAGQASAMERLASNIRHASQKLLRIQLGGTVLGTRAGSSVEFANTALEYLRQQTGLDLSPSENLIDAFAHGDVYAEVADAVGRAAVILQKISQDLRVLSSGPNAGLNELDLPVIQPGSSIMPGKVNPVIPNMVMQYAMVIRSASLSVAEAVVFGEPDINVNGPAVALVLYPALNNLQEAVRLLDEFCVRDMHWNLEQTRANTYASYEEAIESALVSGYDSVARD